jgi:hypothetical protein
MRREVGLWIDHRKAVIVTVSDEGEETRLIRSSVERHVRYSGGSHSRNPNAPQEVSAEDTRDRRFSEQLSRYYDEVVSCIRDANSIQIFGPGEAKGELEKRLNSSELGGRIVGIETVDKMTDRQIAARVRQRFPK